MTNSMWAVLVCCILKMSQIRGQSSVAIFQIEAGNGGYDPIPLIMHTRLIEVFSCIASGYSHCTEYC